MTAVVDRLKDLLPPTFEDLKTARHPHMCHAALWQACSQCMAHVRPSAGPARLVVLRMLPFM